MGDSIGGSNPFLLAMVFYYRALYPDAVYIIIFIYSKSLINKAYMTDKVLGEIQMTQLFISLIFRTCSSVGWRS